MVTGMVTDMVTAKSQLKNKPNIVLNNKLGFSVSYFAVTFVILIANFDLLAKELSIIPNVSSSLVIAEQTIVNDKNESRQGEVLTLSPSLAFGYKSQRLELSTFLQGELISRSPDLVKTEQEQTTETLSINGKAKINLIKDIASVSSTVRQYQQVLNNQNGVLSDKLLDGNSFVDAFDYSTSLRLENPVPSQVKAILDLQTSSRKTEQSSEQTSNNNQINSDTQGINFLFSDGFRDQIIQWNINYSLQDTSRGNYGDVKTESLSAETKFPLYKDVKFIVNGSQSRYQIGQNNSLSNSLDYKQVGIGLGWQFKAGSTFDLISYQSQSQNQSGDEAYIGGTFKWRISSLSSMEFEQSKNAQGDISKLNFSQNNRYIKTRASVSQGISINTRQGFSDSGVESFICPIGSTSVSDCYQPPSLSYNPQVGEQLVNLNQREYDLIEEIVDQTQGVISIGYDNQRKIKANMSYSYSNQKGLENGRQNVIRQSFNTDFSYNYSQKTKLSVKFNTVESDYFAENVRDLDTMLSFNLDKQLTKKLFLQSDYSYRQRQSQRQDWDVTDQRLSISIRYQGN